MKRCFLSVALLLSSFSYFIQSEPVAMTCPCVSKGQKCCCVGCGQECRCVEEYAKQGSVPESCPCPKTAVNTTKRATNNTALKPQNLTSSAHVAVSYGELFDKITILEIKGEQITDTQKLEHIWYELEMLNKSLNIILAKSDVPDLLRTLKGELKELNWKLWQAEDAIRSKEQQKSFDDEFIAIARSIYSFNDARAALKKKISELLHSRIVEEKSYVQR